MNPKKIARLLGIHPLEVEATTTNKPLGELIIERLTQPNVTPQEANTLYNLTTDEIIKNRCRTVVLNWTVVHVVSKTITIPKAEELCDLDCWETIPNMLFEFIDSPITAELDQGNVTEERARTLLDETYSDSVGERCREIIDTPVFKLLKDPSVSLLDAVHAREKTLSNKAYTVASEIIDRLINESLDTQKICSDVAQAYYDFATSPETKTRIINYLITIEE
jgi:hypothetical protein